MSFVSTEFLIFAAVVISLFFRVRQNMRWLLLLAASYFFYAYWQPSYVLLILFSTLVDYFVARALDGAGATRKSLRRFLLAASITSNLGLLFVFKYANLFSQAAADISAAIGIPLGFGALDVLLPVGISFYTFQSMAYTFDVYRGHHNAERHIGIFALYVAFFPQLVAGPIERASNMLPQFRKNFGFDYDRIVDGLRRVLWGVFKKLVIADRLAIYVDAVYGDLQSYSGLILIAATVFFGLQIYLDFSAYSDIAIGIARVLGFKLMENFRRPYLASSVSDFWRRWHISLSTWFRDYVYISLGGNRKGLARQIINLLIVFGASGLWHGANWTFVIWGGYHGVIVALELIFGSRGSSYVSQNQFGRVFSTLRTLLLVFIGWIFFRANSMADIVYVMSHLLDFSQGFTAFTGPFAASLLPQRIELILSFVLIVIVFLADVVEERVALMAIFPRMPLLWRWAVYYSLVISVYASVLVSSIDTPTFYYFQF
ncbi:MAG: MBOAT family protein [Chloroflexi bacterium]|nr:MBOAT family protein [Chloroflexota bacterium]